MYFNVNKSTRLFQNLTFHDTSTKQKLNTAPFKHTDNRGKHIGHWSEFRRDPNEIFSKMGLKTLR